MVDLIIQKKHLPLLTVNGSDTGKYICFQVVTEYKQNQLPLVLDALERMHAHLTAAVVSNDPLFLQARLRKLSYSPMLQTTLLLTKLQIVAMTILKRRINTPFHA